MASLADLVRLPPLALVRGLEDLHTLVRIAAELMRRLDQLESRAEAVQAGLDDALAVGRSIDDAGRQAIDLMRRLDRRGEEILTLGHTIDARGESIVELGERLRELGAEIHSQGVLIEQRAADVATRGGELVATLPTLEAALALVTPLEGAVERLGRMVDRLPGGSRRGPAD